ncbi:DUF397 domain-containing protein [Actinomadura sp. SCN-SB]|uniref:DUF397 domain-containing protein n=1 Tax=Actinomadura sp. SCN-SB TaxID=3373092 RepID=UPI003750B188
MQWRKSSHTGGINDNQCVELARLKQGVGIRGSKNPDAGHLTLTPSGSGTLMN